MQTKRESFIEACMNIGSAFFLSLALTPLFYRIAGIESTGTQNFIAVSCYTVLAVVRSYLWRRYFNRRLVKRLSEIGHG